MLLLVEIPEFDYKRIKRHFDELPKGSTVSAMEYYIASGAPLPHGICGVIANGEPLPDDVKED